MTKTKKQEFEEKTKSLFLRKSYARIIWAWIEKKDKEQLNEIIKMVEKVAEATEWKPTRGRLYFLIDKLKKKQL